MPKVIIFDTETTGLEEEDKIIQVGAIIVELEDLMQEESPRTEQKKSEQKDDNIGGLFDSLNDTSGGIGDDCLFNELCSSNIPIKIEAMSTHGIRQVEVEGKPPFKESDFFKHLNELNSEENYLIAHNLDFDLGMLEKEGYENKMQPVDTLQCAKHVFEIGDEINGYKVPNHKLQTFRYMMLSQENEDEEAKKYGVEIKAHDAIGDVVILKLFLSELAKNVMQKYELKNYTEIMNKMVELTKLPADVKVINFGQYKGRNIVEIEKIIKLNKWGKAEGPSYIDWLHKEQKKQKESNDSKFNKDLFHTLEKIINNRNGNS